MLCGVLFLEKNLSYGKMFKRGEMNEKDCFDDFIVGFGFGVGRVPLVASPRPSLWLPSPLRFKMRGLLNYQLSFPNLYKHQKKPELSFNLYGIGDG
jgi:hypothetical protein